MKGIAINPLCTYKYQRPTENHSIRINISEKEIKQRLGNKYKTYGKRFYRNCGVGVESIDRFELSSHYISC